MPLREESVKPVFDDGWPYRAFQRKAGVMSFRLLWPLLALGCCAWPDVALQSRAVPSARTLSMATAFFLRADGTALTAAHAVAGCRRLLLAPPGLTPVPAIVAWRGDGPDLALLRAFGLPAPNALALASLPDTASTGAPALSVLGFRPNTDGPPDQVAASLLNDRMRSGLPADPRRVLWLRAPGVGHGWSGGPVLDPVTGQVVGVVSFIAPASVPDLVVAVGAGTAQAALRRAGFDPDREETGASLAKAALARLFCWR